MTRTLCETISDSLQLSIGYAETLLKDIPADRFARLAAPGGQVIASNHPAFVLGHLSLYGGRIAELSGATAPAIPDGFHAAFSKDAQCVDDPGGTIYPAMDEIVAFFRETYAASQKAVLAADDETLSRPNPVAHMAKKFPTAGSMASFMGAGHMMLHLGQMSAWRRMEGLGPA